MVSEKDVSYVADLAHLELTAEERARMLKDLNSILDYIERLNQLDTSNVEPMAQVASRYAGRSDNKGSESSRMRCVSTAFRAAAREAMQNAPQTDGTFFKVPKVIER